MLQNFQSYAIYKPTVTTSDYGESIKTYTTNSSILMSIQLDTHNDYQANNYDLTNVTHIGVALYNTNVAVGDRIGESYHVEFIEHLRRYTKYYLSEVV